MARKLTEQAAKPEEEPEPDYAPAAGELERRARVLMEYGFEAQPALLLALGNVSPSAARELLRKGCPPDLAFQILIP